MAPRKISLQGDNVQYLCFEGGVGRGIIYVKVIEALEVLIADQGPFGQPHSYVRAPLFPINTAPLGTRRFRGISGSSAGAITAFMLSMGMRSDEIEAKLQEGALQLIYPGRQEKWAEVEHFFGEPNESAIRTVDARLGKEEYRPDSFSNQPELLKAWKERSRGIIAGALQERLGFERKLYELSDGDKLRERLFLIGQFQRFREGAYRAPGPYAIDVDGVPAKALFHDHDNALIYLHGLLFNRGLFSGLEVRDFFLRLITDRLKPVHVALNGHRAIFDPFMPFKDFFNLTGVDLVVTATNISNHLPLYFSVWHTPDFPVIEAVAMSMNFPLVFRPVYVNMPVRGNDKVQADRYRGLYVDGGMLNNYPIRAFDTIEQKDMLWDNVTPLLFRNEPIQGAYLAVERVPGTEGNEKFLGFRLFDLLANGDPTMVVPPAKGPTREDVFPNATTDRKCDEARFWMLPKYMDDLISTFLFSSGEGQIRFKNDIERTVYIDSTGWDAWDFSHPNIDDENLLILTSDEQANIPSDHRSRLVERLSRRSEIKHRLLNDALERVKYWIQR
ncbi:MAG: patatin-like phospholipase family protein [Flavobacteriales bacterium]|nr:patatin-like phospholipase family protein [Flavobacteriales bacterium]